MDHSDSVDITKEDANRVVLDIATENGWASQKVRENSDPETSEALRSVQIRFRAPVETIALKFDSDDSRFILELIRNANANAYKKANMAGKDPSIDLHLQPENIIIDCNEDGFTPANVRSISSTGESLKQYQRRSISGKGIGFKAVFQVASDVHIQSNWFSFSFRDNRNMDSTDGMVMRTPIPRDEFLPLSARPLTRMTLKIRPNISYQNLTAQFDAVPHNLLLFLSTLKKIVIKIDHSDQRRVTATFRKSEELSSPLLPLFKPWSSSPKSLTILKLTRDVDGSNGKNSETRYFIITTQVNSLPADEARPETSECDVALAFPFSNDLEPIITSPQLVFAFLPIRQLGVSFVIHADFVLQANRQDIERSPRNCAILPSIVESFLQAVLHFRNSTTPLRYHWIKFLPLSPLQDVFFEPLPRLIAAALEREAILFSSSSSILDVCRPSQLRILPSDCLDKHGMPLFNDYLGTKQKTLSREYTKEETSILTTVFHLKEIDDMDLVYRIEKDLNMMFGQRLMGLDTDEDWHSRAADLISTIYLRSPHVRDDLRKLNLVPLIDGTWVKPSVKGLVFPSQSGPDIPQDLVVSVSPKAANNVSRKRMLMHLGVAECQPRRVVGLLRIFYRAGLKNLDLMSSVAHMSYLYWNYDEPYCSRFNTLWLYTSNDTKVCSPQKLLYLQSDDDYGPKKLLEAIEPQNNGGKRVPECQVPYINSAYLFAFPKSTVRHGLSWLAWLEKEMGVRRIPRLKLDTGSLSTEFRHIIAYRPEKLLSTLKKHWIDYEDEMSPTIIAEISMAAVTCEKNLIRALKMTYLPLPSLKAKIEEIGNLKRFPFLKLQQAPETNLLQQWKFLENFGVSFQADLKFYMRLLHQYKKETEGAWLGDTNWRTHVLGIYESIVKVHTEKDNDWLRIKFEKNSYILSPQSFSPSASSPIWIDLDDCIWKGPDNILDKDSLHSVAQYRDNAAVTHFFLRILGIRNANWRNYLEALSNSKQSGRDLELPEKVAKLYSLLSEAVLNDGDWAEIEDTFQENGLIYIPSMCKWFRPSDCLWDSPIKIEGKVIVSESYSEELEAFFLKRLGIPSASLNTLVEELDSLSRRKPSVSDIKDMIWAINEMEPKLGDLDDLLTSEILPTSSGKGPGRQVVLVSCEAEFVIKDRTRIGDIFTDVSFLDFSLEELHQLYAFLHALHLRGKYLSQMCDEATSCDDSGVLDKTLTAQFRLRAHDLLRCASSHRSPRLIKSPQQLYNLLLSTSVLTTDKINTEYTLHLPSKDKVVRVPNGYVFVREQREKLEILVPQTRKDRELCYMIHLPQALAKLFKIDASADKIIGNVLRSSLYLMDDLLDAAGIGEVSKIEAPRRSSVPGSDLTQIMIRLQNMTEELNRSSSSQYQSLNQRPALSESTNHERLSSPGSTVVESREISTPFEK